MTKGSAVVPRLVLAGQVKRVARLHGRDGVLVNQLHLPAAFEDQRELVVAGHRPLEHHAVHEEDGHRLMLARCRLEEQVLKRWPLIAIALPCSRRLKIGRRLGGHDGRDGVLVDQLRIAVAAQQQ
jgi:hypothetical protein